MANLPTRVILFLSSYMPLFLIMAIKYGLPHRYFGGAMLALGLLSAIVLVLYLNAARTFGSDRVVMEKVSAKDTEAMSYIVTYLIPFLDVKIDEPTNLISLGLLFTVVGVLYVHSNLIYINPTLNMLGYHLFEVEIEGGKSVALLSKRGFIEKGKALDVIPLGNQILLEAKNAG
jgi:hypothetical protein